eukprot:278064-Hanusia_phi.AAC.2
MAVQDKFTCGECNRDEEFLRPLDGLRASLLIRAGLFVHGHGNDASSRSETQSVAVSRLKKV